MLTPVPTKRWKRGPISGPSSSAVDTLDSRHDATQEFIPALNPSPSPTAHIAELIRGTTLRAHEALQTAQPDPVTLMSVRAEVVHLECELNRLGLRGLRRFAESLRRRIESAL